MALIDNLHEDMDEVLFASVIEACVPAGIATTLDSGACESWFADFSGPALGCIGANVRE